MLEASTIPRKEVVFLTDLQTASWRRPNPKGNDDGLKTSLAKLEAKQARSQVIDLGARAARTGRSMDLVLDPPIVTAGYPVVAKATIKNFGREPSGEFKVRLVLGDQIVDERPMTPRRPGESETDRDPVQASPRRATTPSTVADGRPAEDRRHAPAGRRRSARRSTS